MGFGKLQVFVFGHAELDPYRIGIAHSSQHRLPCRNEIAYRQVAGADLAGERRLYLCITHVDLRVFQNRLLGRYLGPGRIPLGNGKVILLLGNGILFIQFLIPFRVRYQTVIFRPGRRQPCLGVQEIGLIGALVNSEQDLPFFYPVAAVKTFAGNLAGYIGCQLRFLLGFHKTGKFMYIGCIPFNDLHGFYSYCRRRFLLRLFAATTGKSQHARNSHRNSKTLSPFSMEIT